jgi:hypothetical protein
MAVLSDFRNACRNNATMKCQNLSSSFWEEESKNGERKMSTI